MRRGSGLRNKQTPIQVLSSNGDLTAVLKVKHGFDNNFNNDNISFLLKIKGVDHSDFFWL